MADLIKDRECIDCTHFLMCNGKTKETERCINFEQRENKYINNKNQNAERN